MRIGGELGGLDSMEDESEESLYIRDAREALSLAPSDSLLVSPHCPYSSTHRTSSISPSANDTLRSSTVPAVSNCSAEGTVRTMRGVIGGSMQSSAALVPRAYAMEAGGEVGRDEAARVAVLLAVEGRELEGVEPLLSMMMLIRWTVQKSGDARP